MERVMSVEERIRRAEDIYNRRNEGQYSRNINKNRNEKGKSKSSIKKALKYICICLLIYSIFYAIQNNEHIFSEEFRNEVSGFFTEKTKIYEWYLGTKQYISNKFGILLDESNNENNRNEEQNKKEDKEESKDENNKENVDEKEEIVNKDENAENNNENKTEETKNEEKDIGGADETKENEDKKEENKEEEKELSEQEKMELEAKKIKESISFITPIKGRISSSFGWRNPTTASVPKYHTGLDIAAVQGTKIKSATDGKVVLASSEGDYGNHYQIEIDDIIIVYAHCSKLYLKVGDTVKQGQEIAEVGSTGNSTGPHLHFEIRKGDMRIDPELILDI